MKSFLERNQKVIGLLGALVVLVGTAFSLLLTGGVFRDTYSVVANFADAAGLKSGDDVTVAGLEAGTVGFVEVRGGHVAVELKIDRGVDLPDDTRAEIVVETLLGRKSVNLMAGNGPGQLEDGDVIPLEDTVTPVELLDIGNISRPLLERSDARALEDFMAHVTRITRGKRRQVGQLIRGLAQVSEAVNSRSAELERLLDSLETLSATFAAKDDTLVELIDNLNVVLTNLDRRAEDVERLLEATDAASHETAELVARNRGDLDAALRRLHESLEVLNDHQAELAAGISYLEAAVRGYSSVGYSQGIPNRWANIFVQSLGPLGIDAFFGPCGAFDQALDQLLGPDPRDCDERAEYGAPGDGGGGRRAGGTTRSDQLVAGPSDGTAGQEPADSREPLPEDLGSLLGRVTGDPALVEELRGVLP